MGRNWRINAADGAISDAATPASSDWLLLRCQGSGAVDVGRPSGGYEESRRHLCGHSVDISDAGFSAASQRVFLSMSVVAARLINFYSFIFHCSAVSGSYPAIAARDCVQLTAP